MPLAIRPRRRCSRSTRISATPMWSTGTSGFSVTRLEYGLGDLVRGIRRQEAVRVPQCQPASADRRSERRCGSEAAAALSRQRPHLLVLLRQFQLPLAANQSRKAVLGQPELPRRLHVRQVDRRTIAGLARIQQQLRVAANTTTGRRKDHPITTMPTGLSPATRMNFRSAESERRSQVLGDGWQFIGIHSFTTGTPYTIHARTDFSNAGGDARPDAVPGVSTDPPGGRTGSSGSTRRLIAILYPETSVTSAEIR